MHTLLANSFFPVFAIAVFVAIVLFVEGLYLIWNSHHGPEAKRIELRLRALSASSDSTEHTAVLKNRMLSNIPAIEKLLFSIPRIHQLDRFILQSGLEWTVAMLLLTSLMMGAVFYTALLFTAVSLSFRLAITLAATLMPWAYVQWRRNKRLHKIEQQLPDTLDLISRALRAGHALPSGLKMAGNEMFDPIAREFRITHDEINFGVSMQQALTNFGERVPITDVRYFIVAVLIQREAGGNLAEILDNLSKLIRNRLKFHARIKVLTTEGRMSAWVLGIMPFGLAGLLNYANHDFISVLWTDPAGIKISNVVLGLMAMGAIWLYKLLQIRA